MTSANDEFLAWRERRLVDLAGPDSWLGLIGLFWLEPGRNSVGSSAEAVVRLPDGMGHRGDLLWDEGLVRWVPAGAPALDLETDRYGRPTTVELGHLAFFVVDREGRLAVRLRDRNWAVDRALPVLDYFPDDPDWRIVAAWEALSPPLTMEVPNVSGDLKTVEVAWRAVFEVAGRKVALLPMSVGEQEVFFVFRDTSSGRETYGAGRFLKASAPMGGSLIIDFNRAYNPPCAFTPFATCPLPPPENWLPFPVPAGEMKYSGEH